MGKDSPSPPPPPDYIGAAEATGQSNLEAVRAQTSANRVNQYTPYGSLTYRHTGAGDGGWSSYLTLSPTQQRLLDQQNKTSIGLGNLADRGVGYVDDALSHRLDASSLPKDMVNPGETGYDALMSRIQPQIDESHKALVTQLANQGILPGTEAYDNALRVQNQSENDLRSQAAINGIQIGENAQTQQLGVKTALQNNPINVLNAVRSGSQVTNPTFGAVPQQGNAGGVDYTGAMTGTNNYNMGLYNSGVASANAGNAATMQGVGTAAMAAAMFY